MTQLFETQDQILTTSKFSNDTYGELSVNKAVIDLHLKTPLSLPRNAQLFPENREMVGGFIFKALAKSGLMLVSEEFKYQRVTVDPEVCCVYTFKEEYIYKVFDIDKMELSYGDVFHILEISKALWKTYVFIIFR